MITPQHPWNVLPTLPIGDPDTSTIFRSVGDALTQWEILEVELSLLFAAMLASPSPGKSRASQRTRISGAERAYGMIVGFGARAEMAAAAAEAVFYRHPLRAQIKSLIAEVLNFSPRCNEIAHGLVMHISNSDEHRHHYLCPNYTNARKISYAGGQSEWKYMYTAAQIDRYGDHFSRLAGHVRNIIAQVQRATAERASLERLLAYL